jgi:hypothetical protein
MSRAIGGVDGRRLLWLGGLGAVAALGVVEWPVAVVIGARSLVTEQLARQQDRPASKEGGDSTITASTPRSPSPDCAG